MVPFHTIVLTVVLTITLTGISTMYVLTHIGIVVLTVILCCSVDKHWYI